MISGCGIIRISKCSKLWRVDELQGLARKFLCNAAEGDKGRGDVQHVELCPKNSLLSCTL